MDIERRFRDLRRRECGDKFRHPTEAAARREAELMAREHGGRFTAYHCSWCRAWHVGSERQGS